MHLIDRFLAVHSVVRKKLQLVGVTAMLLACKYEEVSVPVVEDLILISDKAYSRKEVLDMVQLMKAYHDSSLIFCNGLGQDSRYMIVFVMLCRRN